jgi:hypothetical protein
VYQGGFEIFLSTSAHEQIQSLRKLVFHIEKQQKIGHQVQAFAHR